ncbi:ATP-binding cassette domain-containing protein [Nonomuraea sp. NBC_01738]|uniref:ATP-binding cassette domain-containing protein n=1 Tax=Nonomuraea sp. NBC_01738 TaxID=2976003 RepID=UPI002E11B69C|nr:ATP-binding cassette domain-containing protein [Nonomuraea sp. NBC_01738]
MTSIELWNVSKSLGRTLALDGADLSFGPGLVALLGRNGAGKSTLLSIMAGLTAETSGDLHLNGSRLKKDRRPLRAAATFLPQDLRLDPATPAAAYVRYLLDLRKRPDDQLEPLLARFGLTEAATTPIGELSGGARQRVALAYACACDTPILLLDEPTQGLDPWERLTLMDYLAEAAADKLIVYSTHIISDVEAVAPRLVVLDRGQVLHDGPAGDLAAPLVHEVPVEDARGLVTGRDGLYKVRCILDGDPPESAKLVEPTLTDAYLALTR